MWSVFVSRITQEYNGRVNHLSERARYSWRGQGAGRRRAGCAQRGAWHGQLALSSPRRCSILSPKADGGCVTAAGGVPWLSPWGAPGGSGRGDGGCSARRCGGWGPVAAPKTRATWGNPWARLGNPSHIPPPRSLLASQPTTRLSALPSP